jgi:hypothetical protein
MGDSGGPAIDGAGRVIGVLSRGAFDCSAPVYALLPSYDAWISAEIQRAGGEPDAGIVDEDAATPDAREDDADTDAAIEEADAEAPDAGEAQREDATVTADNGARQNGEDRGDEGCGCDAAPGRADSGALGVFALLACHLLQRCTAHVRKRR